MGDVAERLSMFFYSLLSVHVGRPPESSLSVKLLSNNVVDLRLSKQPFITNGILH